MSRSIKIVGGGLDMIPYLSVDWTIADLPKQVQIPIGIYQSAIEDIVIQIELNTAYNEELAGVDAQVKASYSMESQMAAFYVEMEEDDNAASIAVS